MLADNGYQDWWKLTSDNTGSYLNGTRRGANGCTAGHTAIYNSNRGRGPPVRTFPVTSISPTAQQLCCPTAVS